MKVYVCDAICGAGKTSACINMMNERVESKFIFVTQFLSEVDRITDACKSRSFVTPFGDVDTGKTKLSDIIKLLKDGKNIATTHSLFVSYTDEVKNLIREKGYVLVLDESVDAFHMSGLSKRDLSILINSNSVRDVGDRIEWINDDYDGEFDERDRFRDEMLLAKSKNFLKYDEDYFFWSIPPELFTSFREAYILTYMFDAQPLRNFFEIHNIDYELIGAMKEGEGYRFCGAEEMDRARDLRGKIHILDIPKLNDIGKKRSDLSFSWYRKLKISGDFSGIERIRKNMINVFKNIWKATADDIMWTTFKEYKPKIAGKGYLHSFLPYNKRASNDYCNKHYLAYCVNNFPRPWEERFFRDHGSNINGDMYALSILVQWIFRSAIRRGEEIWVYIPSVRMRALLNQWIENLAEGKDLEPIEYKTPRKKKMVAPKRGRPRKNKTKKEA